MMTKEVSDFFFPECLYLPSCLKYQEVFHGTIIVSMGTSAGRANNKVSSLSSRNTERLHQQEEALLWYEELGKQDVPFLVLC